MTFSRLPYRNPREPNVVEHGWVIRRKRVRWSYFKPTRPDVRQTGRWQRRGNILFDQNGAPVAELPPVRAEKLLLFVLPARLGEALLGDLTERFPWIEESYGDRFARLWYWRQTIGALFSYLGLRVTGALSLATVARFARRLLSR
jgi:hypothetical protein